MLDGFEHPREIQGIVKSYGARHLSNGKAGVAQQTAGLVDAIGLQVGVGGNTEILLECSIQLTAADTHVVGDIVDADIAGVVVLDKSECVGHIGMVGVACV